MQIFNLTLSQMLMMFTMILVGFLLRKKSLMPDNSYVTMSKLETFVFLPATYFFSQMTKCTAETFSENWLLIMYGACTIICMIFLAGPLSALFVRDHKKSSELAYQRNIYRYALTFSNHGYVGNFIVLGVFGQDMFFKYTLVTFFVGLFAHSWGLYLLIPKDKNASLWTNVKKGLTAPPVLAIVAGMVFGLLGLKQYIPDFILRALDNAGACQGPVAMLLAGFVIGGYDFSELIRNGKVYAASLLRLVIIPAVLMLVLKLLGTSDEIMTLLLVCVASPLGLNTIVYPAAYGGDTKTGASMAMISSTLSVITIPLMYLLFIVLL